MAASATGAEPAHAGTTAGVLLVDGHVHLYACHSAGRFFDSAHANFARARRALGFDPVATRYCLLFVETRADDAFAALARSAARGEAIDGAARGWRAHTTPESEVLQLHRADGAELLVVAGYQIETRERLELLALGTRERIPDGREFYSTLAAVTAAGAIAVAPWGFGKWWGARGRLLERAADAARRGEFALAFGDSGGRPAFAPPPRLLRRVAAAGLTIVPGSDPLPFPAQDARVATYGFAVPDVPRDALAWASLRAHLARGAPVRPFGCLTPPLEFVSSQVRMQMRRTEVRHAG